MQYGFSYPLAFLYVFPFHFSFLYFFFFTNEAFADFTVFFLLFMCSLIKKKLHVWCCYVICTTKINIPRNEK